MVAGMFTITFNGTVIPRGLCRSNLCLSQKLEATSGIMWEAIQDSKLRGDVKYDLQGVNPTPQNLKEQGIYNFKKRWGGKFIHYAEYTKVFRPGRERLVRYFRGGLRRLGVR